MAATSTTSATRRSTQINRDNVANLKPSWRVSLNGSGTASKYSGQGQPLVYEGVIYMVTGADDVFAVSVDTRQNSLDLRSEARRQHQRRVLRLAEPRSRDGGRTDLMSGQLDGKLVALDQRTGAVAWSTQAERWQDGFSITAHRSTTTGS